MRSELELQVAQYKANAGMMTNRQKAEAERDVWNSTTMEEREGLSRRDWLAQKMGAGTRESEERSILISQGSACDILWDRIDKKQILLSTAARIVKDARVDAHNNQRSIESAMAEAIRRYDALPHVSFVGGIPVRKKSIGTGSDPTPKPDVQTKVEIEKEKEFWGALRTMVNQYLAMKLKGIDPHQASLVTKSFEQDVRMVVEDLRRRIYKVQRSEQDTIEIMGFAMTKSKVEEACSILHMDPPNPFGAPIDLAKAKKQKWLAARKYHPDAHRGDESMRPLYDAVVQAYVTLEDYAERYNHKTPNGEEGSNAKSG